MSIEWLGDLLRLILEGMPCKERYIVGCQSVHYLCTGMAFAFDYRPRRTERITLGSTSLGHGVYELFLAELYASCQHHRRQLRIAAGESGSPLVPAYRSAFGQYQRNVQVVCNLGSPVDRGAHLTRGHGR